MEKRWGKDYEVCQCIHLIEVSIPMNAGHITKNSNGHKSQEAQEGHGCKHRLKARRAFVLLVESPMQVTLPQARSVRVLSVQITRMVEASNLFFS